MKSKLTAFAESASAPLDARLAEPGGGRVDTPARLRKPTHAAGKTRKANKKTTK